MGYKELPNYTEEIVGFALESYLAVLSFPFSRFTLEPFSRNKERYLGADARLDDSIKGIKPLYLQFKRPESWLEESTSKVVTDRKTLSLNITPRTLFFKLREKSKTQKDFQHNILCKLRRRVISNGIAEVAYICPLFLDRAAYRFNLHISGLRRFWRSPFRFEDFYFNKAGDTFNKKVFENFPVLREHICIPPTEDVKDAKHYYSFTESGKEVCFHSPQKVESSKSLMDTLSSIYGEIYSEKNSMIHINEFKQLLNQLIEDTNMKIEVSKENILRSWLDFGYRLEQEYGIVQYAFIERDIQRA